MDEPTDARRSQEDEGLPHLHDDVYDEEVMLPGDTPRVLDSEQTTAQAQREGEYLGRKLRREQPEGEPSGAEHRLVEPDAGGRPDGEKDMVAGDAGPGEGGLTAEEAALRVEDEP